MIVIPQTVAPASCETRKEAHLNHLREADVDVLFEVRVEKEVTPKLLIPLASAIKIFEVGHE